MTQKNMIFRKVLKGKDLNFVKTKQLPAQTSHLCCENVNISRDVNFLKYADLQVKTPKKVLLTNVFILTAKNEQCMVTHFLFEKLVDTCV